MIKDDLAYKDHILDCIRKIKEFSKGLSLEEFNANELVQDAIIRNIEIIGEASKRISKKHKTNVSARGSAYLTSDVMS